MYILYIYIYTLYTTLHHIYIYIILYIPLCKTAHVVKKLVAPLCRRESDEKSTEDSGTGLGCAKQREADASM